MVTRLPLAPADDRRPIKWPPVTPGADPCLVCHNVDLEPLYAPTYFGSIADASEFFLAGRTATAHGPIVRCRGCGFVFTSPRFSPEQYSRIYGAIGASIDHDGDALDQAKVARFSRLAKIVRSYVSKDADFLDLGCGDGSFLRLMDDPRGRGFEVGPAGHGMAGRSPVTVGDWADYAGSRECPPGSLDFITAFDVFEHLPLIDQDVSLIRSVLKPGGFLFVTVPNAGSAIARLLGARWNMLLLEHLWYFTPVTLDRLLARHGFEPVESRAVPFDAPISHIASRLAQTFGARGKVSLGPLDRVVLPTPAGVMLSVYRVA